MDADGMCSDQRHRRRVAHWKQPHQLPWGLLLNPPVGIPILITPSTTSHSSTPLVVFTFRFTVPADLPTTTASLTRSLDQHPFPAMASRFSQRLSSSSSPRPPRALLRRAASPLVEEAALPSMANAVAAVGLVPLHARAESAQRQTSGTVSSLLQPQG